MVLELETPRRFDVICAGEALWSFAPQGLARLAASVSRHFQPGGGALRAAFALVEHGLRVGLATAIPDDRAGRLLAERVVATGIDAGGVRLTSPTRSGLVVLQGAFAAQKVVQGRADDEPPIAIPEGWIAQVLLLSGLSPVVPQGAALCKAARRARRVGTTVVIDVNAKWHLWAGRDPRVLRTLLREADIVRCSTEDLAVLGLDETRLRASLRPSAVLVLSSGPGEARASGPFGEIVHVPRRGTERLPAVGSGDALTAAICAELARAGHTGDVHGSLWERAFQRAHAS